VLGDSAFALWNTIIGGGDAGCASSSTLVLIKVQGPPRQYLGDVQVSVLAESVPEDDHAARDTLYEGKTKLAITSAEGLYFVPVWLYDTGCTPIEIRAWIDGARDRTIRQETIPFMCGE
jgi:hypothetical protein